MIDREQLIAWANAQPDDFVKSAVRDADREAIDNVDGDDEHTMFYDALFATLGGKRANGRPKKAVDYDEMKALVDGAISATGKISYAPLNELVGKHFGISPNTASKHTMPVLLIPKLLRDNGLDSLCRRSVLADDSAIQA